MTRSRDTADTQDNLGGAVAPFVAGKNKIINGDFSNWQRGTSFSSAGYTADRWFCNFSGATGTVSRQTFTPGTAPVAGYEGQFFLRLATTVADDNSRVEQKMEDVRTFAGQTVTVSLWAKADSARTITLSLYQSFGSGGSTDVQITTQTISVTTSWTRFTKTFDVPSVAGKTIGTGSFFSLEILHAPNATFTLDLWGVQVEAGSVATPFTTASGSIGGELALCQRYCYVIQGNTTNASSLGTGYWNGATAVVGFIISKSKMRTTPTLIFSAASDFEALQVGVSWNAVSAVTLAAEANADTAQIQVTTTGGVSGQAANIRLKALSTAYVGLVAEL
jgi:hypothetical protein